MCGFYDPVYTGDPAQLRSDSHASKDMLAIPLVQHGFGKRDQLSLEGAFPGQTAAVQEAQGTLGCQQPIWPQGKAVWTGGQQDQELPQLRRGTLIWALHGALGSFRAIGSQVPEI